MNRINLSNFFYNFFPDICYLCKNKKNISAKLCPDCREKIPIIKEPICPGCGGENDGILELCPKCLKEDPRPWSQAIAISNYINPIDQIIKDFKYNGKTYYAKLLGELASEILIQRKVRADYIVPIPLHWTRQFIRGYNQSQLIADVISIKTKIPILNLLKRVKKTPKQANLSREERKKNLNNAFKLNDFKRAKFKIGTIVLFDDVLTTGSTLESAALTILDANICEKINILVIARG
ncbi:MAG TPA: ComF family protein [Victivallales bacterium]|nr:ComF family protein [Victivallales bacterium]HPO90403.1 ComF family protein [Victivallales bacterium]HRU01241.1 ComF family protein [Victivallales bacterium]